MEEKKIRLYSSNLLGDTLLQSPAIRSWKIAHPDEELHYYCTSDKGAHLLFQDNPYIDYLYVDTPASLCAPLLLPMTQMDAAQAFNLGASHQKSLAWGYGQMLGVEIDSLKYDYVPAADEDEWALRKLEELGDRVVLIGRHSASCTSNDPKIRVANKCVTNRLWVQVANWLLREGFTPVAIGSKKDAEDQRYAEWPGKLLYGEGIRNIASLCRFSTAVLTVDNGIRHITAAAGGNLFCISGRIPLWLIRCEPVRQHQKIYEDYRELPMVTSQFLIEGAKKVL